GFPLTRAGPAAAMIAQPDRRPGALTTPETAPSLLGAGAPGNSPNSGAQVADMVGSLGLALGRAPEGGLHPMKPPHGRGLLLTALVRAGCGGAPDDLPRQPVYGRVRLNGEPLAQGTIQFQPDGGPRAAAISGGALIQDGSYSIPRDQGLVPGHYKVSI